MKKFYLLLLLVFFFTEQSTVRANAGMPPLTVDNPCFQNRYAFQTTHLSFDLSNTSAVGLNSVTVVLDLGNGQSRTWNIPQIKTGRKLTLITRCVYHQAGTYHLKWTVSCGENTTVFSKDLKISEPEKAGITPREQPADSPLPTTGHPKQTVSETTQSHVTAAQADSVLLHYMNLYFNTENRIDPVYDGQYRINFTQAFSYNGNTVLVTPRYSAENGWQAIFKRNTSWLDLFINAKFSDLQKGAMEDNDVRYFNADTTFFQDNVQLADSVKSFIDRYYVQDLKPDPVAGVPESGKPGKKAFVYPNPAAQVLYFQPVGNRFAVMDLTGRKMITGTVNTRQARYKIDVSRLQPGVYLLIRYEDNINLQVNKFIKR